MVKSGCFGKDLQCRAATFFQVKEGYKFSCVKIIMCVELLGDCYLFEILHTSSTVKTRWDVVKS